MQEFSGCSSEDKEKLSASFNETNRFAMTDPQETDQSYYYSYQLIDGVRSVCSYLDAGISRLFSILPGVSAESVEPDEHEVAILEKDDRSLETARVDMAYVAYVTSNYLPAIRAINTDNNEIVHHFTIEAGSDLREIAISPDGNYAYVTDYTSGFVYVINTHNYSIVKKVLTVNNSLSIAIAPNGKRAYVLSSPINGPTDTISIIETSGNYSIVHTTIPGCNEYGFINPQSVAITDDSLYVYVACQSNESVIVIETTNNTVSKRFPVAVVLGLRLPLMVFTPMWQTLMTAL